MITCQYLIPGRCIPKARPRIAKNGHFYTPQKTRQYESMVARLLKSQKAKISDKPLKVFIKVYRKHLKGWTKSEKELAKQGKMYPTTRPDVDNYAKSILDGADGILYHDDSQIVDLRVMKLYGDKEQVVIEVSELE